jgi:polar amino acid transport system substrate-binding protein
MRTQAINKLPIEDILKFTTFHLKSKCIYTYLHSINVAYYSSQIAKTAVKNNVDTVCTAALLHDIGKIMIDNTILHKKGSLTAHEYEEIKRHTIYGYEYLNNLGFHQDAVYIRHHHEKWDGTGYPDGLRGNSIPLPSRIICIADAFDAMTTDRIYKKHVSFDEAIKVMKKNAYKQFDAELLYAFIQSLKKDCKREMFL